MLSQDQEFSDRDDIRLAAKLIASAEKVAAFTGAGASTESGIPDFRSPGGIWTRFRNVPFDEFLADLESRREYWRQKAHGEREFGSAQPNHVHRVLAGWERQGKVCGVITQNIDGLHQQAGSANVIEIHGTARKIACLNCKKRFPTPELVEEFLRTEEPPLCPACGGLLKYATISFGQALDPDVLQAATKLAMGCDLMLVVGSSLVVEPAASLPRLARASGASVLIVNREPTPQDSEAVLVLRGSAGPILLSVDKDLGQAAIGGDT